MNAVIFGKRKQGKSTLALALASTWHSRVLAYDPNNMLPLLQSISVEEIPAWLESTRNSQSYHFARVGPVDSENVSEVFAEFSENLWEEHDISIIVDEAHMLQGSNSLDANLDRWNRRSSATVAVIQTTHRLVDAHPDSRYHTDIAFFFRADLPRELKTIREHFGDEVAAKVPHLQPYQLVAWSRSQGGVVEVDLWPNGKDWYINLENENYAA